MSTSEKVDAGNRPVSFVEMRAQLAHLYLRMGWGESAAVAEGRDKAYRANYHSRVRSLERAASASVWTNFVAYLRECAMQDIADGAEDDGDQYEVPAMVLVEWLIELSSMKSFYEDLYQELVHRFRMSLLTAAYTRETAQRTQQSQEERDAALKLDARLYRMYACSIARVYRVTGRDAQFIQFILEHPVTDRDTADAENFAEAFVAWFKGATSDLDF